MSRRSSAGTLNTDAQVTLLVLLDLLQCSFDTVCQILRDRLRSRLSVTDQALNCFTPYLSDCTQRVAVNGDLSDTFTLVPRCAARDIPWNAFVRSIYLRTIRYRESSPALLYGKPKWTKKVEIFSVESRLFSSSRESFSLVHCFFTWSRVIFSRRVFF